MFVHHVFFWLKEDLAQEQVSKFEELVMTLPSIEAVKFGDVGKPAETDRPVIDRSYTYSLLLVFEDESKHDEYQPHPVHKKFVEECSGFWSKVLIYDSNSL